MLNKLSYDSLDTWEFRRVEHEESLITYCKFGNNSMKKA